MAEEIKYQRKWFDRNFLPISVGAGLFAAIAVPWYVHNNVNNSGQEFLQNPVVTMESQVVGERYVQPSTSPSKYFLSVDDVIKGRVTVEVIDANDIGLSAGIESPISKESVDARIDIGTRVKIKAREVGPLEYKAFAHEIINAQRGR